MKKTFLVLYNSFYEFFKTKCELRYLFEYVVCICNFFIFFNFEVMHFKKKQCAFFFISKPNQYMKIWIIEYFFMLPHLYNFLLTILSLFLKHLIDIHLSAFRFYAPRISKDEVELYEKICIMFINII